MTRLGEDWWQLTGYEAAVVTHSHDIYSTVPPTDVPVWYFMARTSLYRNVLLRACALTCSRRCLQHDRSEHERQRSQLDPINSSKWFVEVGSDSERRIEAAVTVHRLLGSA